MRTQAKNMKKQTIKITIMSRVNILKVRVFGRNRTVRHAYGSFYGMVVPKNVTVQHFLAGL